MLITVNLYLQMYMKMLICFQEVYLQMLVSNAPVNICTSHCTQYVIVHTY